jgi:hypothetical protein
MLTTLVGLIAFGSPDTFVINAIPKSKDPTNLLKFPYRD